MKQRFTIKNQTSSQRFLKFKKHYQNKKMIKGNEIKYLKIKTRFRIKHVNLKKFLFFINFLCFFLILIPMYFLLHLKFFAY